MIINAYRCNECMAMCDRVGEFSNKDKNLDFCDEFCKERYYEGNITITKNDRIKR